MVAGGGRTSGRAKHNAAAALIGPGAVGQNCRRIGLRPGLKAAFGLPARRSAARLCRIKKASRTEWTSRESRAPALQRLAF